VRVVPESGEEGGPERGPERLAALGIRISERE
jgi:hypothetical protein